MSFRWAKRLGGLALLALFCSCSFYQATPEVKAFLTGLSGSKAYDSLSRVKVEETYRSLDLLNQELGRMSISFEMDKSDATSFYWHRINLYSGDQIVNGITKAEYLLKKVEGSYHTYIKTNDAQPSDLVISDDKASSLIRDIIYTPQESYDSGGLYYGDTFKVNTGSFPQDCFTLDAEKSVLTFACSYENTLKTDAGADEKLDSDQKISINAQGLLTASYELLRVVSSGKAGENILTPNYQVELTPVTSL
jgi:hypothetical protein